MNCIHLILGIIIIIIILVSHNTHSLWCRLEWTSAFTNLRFQIFFFPMVNSNITWVHYAGDKNHCSCTVYHCSQHCLRTKKIKNGSYSTIHTFKNYFATVFSVFSFSNNKFSPNGSIVCVWIRIISSCVCVFWLFFFWVPATLFDQVNCEQCIRALFMDPKTLFFSNFFIKNEFHDTIHTFKNYFVTVFLVSTKISSNDRIQDI